MVKITVTGFDQRKEIVGECLRSELYWAENVEDFHHLKNGQYATTQTPTKCFHETWEVSGKQINLTKFIRQIGKWVDTSKHEKEFRATRKSIEYVVVETEQEEDSACNWDEPSNVSQR